MQDSLDESVRQLQAALDETARECLRYICTHDLKPAQVRKLAQFMFGCMNQKHELPRRVAIRGAGEFRKILTFVDRACEVLREIDEEPQEPDHAH